MKICVCIVGKSQLITLRLLSIHHTFVNLQRNHRIVDKPINNYQSKAIQKNVDTQNLQGNPLLI